MELRDIEIFLALAEELHFGRTAERLHITPSRVSHAIKKQERRIGAPLFERTSRAVALTPIGRRLRDDLQQAYDLIQSGMARAASAAHGVRDAVRLGAMGVSGNEIQPLIDTFRARYPDSGVEIAEFHFSDPFTRLRAGEVDLQLMWLPIREPDLMVGPVMWTEHPVLAVARHDELASRESVSMEELGGRLVFEPGTTAPDYWIEALVPRRTPAGRLIPRGPHARSFHEILALVASGRALTLVNGHVPRYYSHPDITYVPVHDAPLTEWVLVWQTANQAAHLHAFVQLVRDLGPLPITTTPQ
ncbi:LysR family transcriptional regulator [Actinomadura kijaniata]|uniref:LysR family transcriptional regulator n=1 Tax=Actinomadura kijaniata TaxID=46161 RepID=UPI003F1C1AD2